MKTILQSSRWICGKNDHVKVTNGLEQISTDALSLIIPGQPRSISTQNENLPMVSFLNFQDDTIYYIKGRYYFTASDLTFKPIGDLATIFNTRVTAVVFSGFYISENVFYSMVGVGEELFIASETTKSFISVGRLSEFLPNNIVSVYWRGKSVSPIFYGMDSNGQQLSATVEIGSDLHPKFTFGAEAVHEFSVMSFKPTGSNIHRKDGKFLLTFLNRNLGFYSVDYESSQVQRNTGTFNVDFTNDIDTLNGTSYAFVMLSGDRQKTIQIKNESEFVDGVPKEKIFSYNSKLQLKNVRSNFRVLNDKLDAFDLVHTYDTNYQYVWESTEPYARSGRNAIGLLYLSEEIVTEDGESQYLSRQKAGHNTREDVDYDIRLYYKNTYSYNIGSAKEWILHNEVITYSDGGIPSLTGDIELGNVELLSKSIYSSKYPTLVVATFDGVISMLNKSSSHYCGFETYEDFTIEGSIISNDYFQLTQAAIRSTSYLGERCAFFLANGKILAGESLFVDPLTKYVLSYYLRTNDTIADWKYVEKIFLGSDIKDKVLENIDANSYVDHVAIRPVDCACTISIFNRYDLTRRSVIDNNGVATVFMFNSRGDVILSYVIDPTPGTDKIAINHLAVSGFSRFNGNNMAYQSAIKSTLFNTIFNFDFRSLGQFLSTNEDPLVLNSSSVFLFGNCIGNGHTIKLIKSSGKIIEIRFENAKVEIFVNRNQVVEPIDADTLMENISWCVAMVKDILLVIVNGHLLTSYITDSDAIVSVQSLSSEIISSWQMCGPSKIILAKNFNLSATYYDFIGNAIQFQTNRLNIGEASSFMVVQQSFYDKASNLVAKTLKGSYPLANGEKPFFYRATFASIIWPKNIEDSTDPRGILTGELSDFYKNGLGKEYCIEPTDYQWPYVFYMFEENGIKRPIRKLQAGASGFKNSSVRSYQSVTDFKNYAHRFDGFGSFKYSGTGDQYEIGDEQHSLGRFDVSDVFNSAYGQNVVVDPISTDSVGSEIQHIIRKNNLLGDNAVFGEIHYQSENRFQPQMKVYNGYFNRVTVADSVDSGIRILINDSAGRNRIAMTNASATIANYSKYDRLNRVIESGTIMFTQLPTIVNFLDKVDNPSFPTSADGEVTKLYEYSYDFVAGVSDRFSKGKLCQVNNIAAGIIEQYQYDYLGHRIKSIQKLHNEDKSLIVTTEKDLLGNILKIAMHGFELEFIYSVVGNINDVIINYGSTRKVLKGGIGYDINDKPSVYSEVNSEIFFDKYDMHGRFLRYKRNYSPVYYAGKVYSKNAFSHQTVENLEYKGWSNKDISYQHDGFMRLIKMSTTGLSATQVKEIQYDRNNNISNYTVDGVQYSFVYKIGSNRIFQIVKNGVVSVEFKYDGLGNITEMHDVAEGNIWKFTSDSFYLSKAAQIAYTSVPLGIDVTQRFDYLGHRILEDRKIGAISTTRYFVHDESGQLLFSSLDGQSPEIIYIRMNEQLIAQYDIPRGKWTSLFHDDTGTLLLASQGSDKMGYGMYQSPWGVPMLPDVDYINQLRFFYRDMEYDLSLQLYNTDGELYFPQYGVSSSPSLSFTSGSQYRYLNNDPVQ